MRQCVQDFSPLSIIMRNTSAKPCFNKSAWWADASLGIQQIFKSFILRLSKFHTWKITSSLCQYSDSLQLFLMCCAEPDVPQRLILSLKSLSAPPPPPPETFMVRSKKKIKIHPFHSLHEFESWHKYFVKLQHSHWKSEHHPLYYSSFHLISAL